MKRLVLVMSVSGLLLGSSAALADTCTNKRHHHVHKKHKVHHAARRSTSPYPVYSYSVPTFGPYSGYAFYDAGYPAYLPKWPRQDENPVSVNSDNDDDLPFLYDGNANRDDLLRH